MLHTIIAVVAVVSLGLDTFGVKAVKGVSTSSLGMFLLAAALLLV